MGEASLLSLGLLFGLRGSVVCGRIAPPRHNSASVPTYALQTLLETDLKSFRRLVFKQAGNLISASKAQKNRRQVQRPAPVR